MPIRITPDYQSGCRAGLRLSLLSLALFALPPFSQAEDTFSTEALEIDNPGSAPVDLSLFSREEGQLPGSYNVDIWCNNEYLKTDTIAFVVDEKGSLAPQISPSLLIACGVNVKALPLLASQPQDKPLKDPAAIIPNFHSQFDFNLNRLNLSIPQALMNTQARGAIDPRYWDEGVPALFTSYSYTGSQSWQDDVSGRDDSSYLNLHSGANLGSWRLRNYSTWSYNKSAEGITTQRWQSVNTWIQRDMKAIQGTLIAGESYTPSDIFDSLQFTGMQLTSDDNMLSDSQRGFAPTIRGIANSNARITVRQNGVTIYQTYVSPGAFVINDLYPTSSSGDLDVEIREADGSIRHFVQPFSEVPIMQREGHLKYALTGGKYRSSTGGDEPGFGQFTLMYGLPHDLTLYGGSQLAADYQAATLGMGITPGSIGSFSVDVTQANAHIHQNDSDNQGQSIRFQYAKEFTATDSTVTLAGYRYSTSGYYTFNEANDNQDDDDDYALSHNKRSKLQVDFSQQLDNGNWGGLAFSGWQQAYWGESEDERGASVSYNGAVGSISYSLMYTYSKSPDNGPSDQQFSLNINLPLSQWLAGSYASYGLTTSRKGDTTQRMTVNGTALARRNLNWNIGQGYTNHGEGNSGQASLDYKGGYGDVNAGYNYDRDSRQLTYGMDGAIVVHPWGVTLSQPLSGDMDAMALIRAPGAANVGIENNIGVHTDWRGYTIVPYLNPYRKNHLALDNEDLGDNVDVDSNVITAIPTEGAVVLADYPTHIGARVLLTLTRVDGRPVPFGATVTHAENDRESIVGNDGEVFLTGVSPQDTATVKWGENPDQQCHATIVLPPQGNLNTAFESIVQLSVICR